MPTEMRPVGPAKADATLYHETYVTSLASGFVEYGFTFKTESGGDDTVFDLVLGAVPHSDEANTMIRNAWRDNLWAAEAISKAAARLKP